MKKIYLCIIFTLPIFAFAQSPCNDTQVTLSSQAEVDSFPSQFCNTLCALTIQGDDITNLDSLYVLQSVGELRITFNPVLNDIGGLLNITTIGTTCFRSGMTIEMNNVLSNLDGLSSLTSIAGTFYLNDNTMLSDLNGLSNLTDIDALSINSNASLQDLDGFSGLTYLTDLAISNNPGLTDLNGLSNITSIGGAVSISYNDGLTSLDGLMAVTRIDQFLSIHHNADMTSLVGLSNINHIGQFSASGMSLEVSYNDALTSLNGLQGLDSIPGTATIEGNASLLDLDGLSSLKTLDAVGDSYNTGIRIAGNSSLTNISGIASIQTIGKGRAAWFEVVSNDALTTIDSIGLKAINGYLGSRLLINGNEHLADIDGLLSLERVSSGMSAVVQIDSNPSLQNLDGISNLNAITSAQGGTLTITNNTELGSFCGLYTVFHAKGINCGSTQCYSTMGVTISGNERDPTPEQIEAEGPCGATLGQPSGLVFSQVTSEGMHVRFSRAASFANGYLVLMKSHGPSAPNDVPQDGVTYHVGQVLGSSSIVVSVNADTTFVVSGLIPSTPYYFDVFSYRVTENGIDYLTINPLEGSQSTTSGTALESSLTFTDVTDASISVMLDSAEPGNYIALMKAFGYPSPNDVPVDGTEYHVGGTVGSSTIIVNIGDGSVFTVNGLMPDVTYFFDVYRYDPSTFTYEPGPAKGSQATNESDESLRAYPNPFDVTTTIPFVVSQEEATVQVAIYDAMGREVNVLAAGSFAAGRHEASWDGFDKFGRRVTAGVYIYSVRSDGGVVTGRVSVR
jgi:hypothetical protein